jgi:hypothetical protein
VNQPPACLTDDEVDVRTIWGHSLDGRQCLGPYDVHSNILSKEPLQGGTAQGNTWRRGTRKVLLYSIQVATLKCFPLRATSSVPTAHSPTQDGSWAANEEERRQEVVG